ncbi:M81 family metallopeptidase [Paenibacillus aestuarii]|uniref:M81 family metallopeptidase n=1 Tax=Paenibacillus aestuarii TaxID=516965 RepID=A0ABW0K9C2_9BACL|nr:M81 family metallopeptidase [Paenibacillus aestuarii]
MRIAIGQVAHETNTFSVVKTSKDMFELWEWAQGDTLLANHRGVRDFLGGMIHQAEQMGIEVLPVFSTIAYPSGMITKETYEDIKQTLLSAIQQEGPIDAVCLALHGAGVAEGAVDLEGELLKAVRNLVGPLIPIVVTLDLHGNLTDTMVEHADAMLGVHLYPHVDCYERGLEAVELIHQIVTGQVKPVMHLTKLPLILPTSTTNQSPAKDINERCWTWEQEENVIDCAFFHGFPYTDTPDVSASILTITNDNPELAKLISEDVAIYLWEKREEFTPTIISPEEGIQLALQTECRPIVINESSDNPGGGTPGDGTYLLKAMLDAKLNHACFGSIFDPEVVEIACEVGVGANIQVQIGGKTDTLHGDSLPVDAYVKAITDGTFVASTPMGQGGVVNLGKSVRLQVDGVDIIVCSVKAQTLDEQIFLLHGIDVNQYKIVALKSSQHFRASFEPIAKRIITVNSPGLSSQILTSFPYEQISQPIYPLHPSAKWPK